MSQRRAPYHAKLPRVSEHDEQANLIAWAHMQEGAYPELRWLAAIPNGGLRDPITAKRLQAEGVKPGVPDLCLLVPAGGYFGLLIEMKAQDGKVSDAQKEWLEYLNSAGYLALVCWGSQDAIRVILEYLALPHVAGVETSAPNDV